MTDRGWWKFEFGRARANGGEGERKTKKNAAGEIRRFSC